MSIRPELGAALAETARWSLAAVSSRNFDTFDATLSLADEQSLSNIAMLLFKVAGMAIYRNDLS